MMRLRYSLIITTFVFCTLCVFGLVHKTTYSDITSEPNYMDSLMVAEIPESFAVAECERLLADLPNSQYIFRVKVVEGFELYCGQGRQLMRVEDVFEGDGVTPGDCIYVTSDRWVIFWDNEVGTSMEHGFVNTMEVGGSYLIFCAESVDALDKKIPVYRTSKSFTITPIFSYKDSENVIVPPGGESTYIPYFQVKNNEFFACTDVALTAWENLKSTLIEKYK